MSKPSDTKSRLHTRNKHRERYDFAKLTEVSPELKPFVAPNKYGDDSVDFSNPEAVKALNGAILKLHYNISYWDIPAGFLCPPIPGRADYIHYMADLLGGSNFGSLPKGNHVVGLDIGVGANCIYPLLGAREYDWSFIGSDINPEAIKSAQNIIDQNPPLSASIELRLQENSKDSFYGIMRMEDRIDFTICNPPFHSSAEAAQSGSMRKVKNLGLNKGAKSSKPVLNFGGQANELWCEGGENKFIRNLIRESKKFDQSCFWFSSLVSKQSNVKGLLNALTEVKAVEVRNISLGTSNKSSRILAWTFLSPDQQKNWRESRWRKNINQ